MLNGPIELDTTVPISEVSQNDILTSGSGHLNFEPN